LGGLGDGGLLVCRDEALARKARALRNHGAEKTYRHAHIGGNFRLDALQAAFLRVKLTKFESYSTQRKSHALFYTGKLSKLPQATLEGMEM
jgi:dTDP-4-amino-4,6-dideoxygalactose transaminase